MYRQISQMLSEAGRVLVTAHLNPDGDALGSSLGLMHVLKDQGKKVFVHSAGPIPREYHFLPGLEEISNELPPADQIDAAVLLDCHEPARAGEKAEAFLGGLEQKILVVDHHQGQADFGKLAWVDPGFAATAQMLTHLIREAGWNLSREGADCLFTGLTTDTGSFRYSNTTSEVFEAASWLVKTGADPWKVSQEVYAVRPEKLRLVGAMMEGLQTSLEGRLAVGQISRQDLIDHGCESRDLDNVVEMIRAIPGVEVAALLKENKGGAIKASLRSRGKLDVAQIAISGGGGGHHNAAGMTLDGPLSRASREITELLSSSMKEARL